MIISETQKQDVKNKAVENILKAGRTPTSYSINSAINTYFLNNKEGYPVFKPLNLKPHEVSDRVKWNESIKDLEYDINIANEALNSLFSKVNDTEDNLLTKQAKVQASIMKTNLRLKSLKNILASDEAFISKSYIFDNFYETEFYGNNNINLPYTNAFVDLLYKRVTSHKKTLPENKIDLSNAVISIEASNVIEEGSNPEVILSNTLNENYIIKQYSDNNGVAAIKINVELEEEQYVSTISMALTTLKECSASLILTNAEGLEIKVYSEEFYNNMEWNFPKEKIKSFSIILIKNEADSYDESAYYYYYMINNIMATNEVFELNSAYISNKIEFNEILDTVYLDVNENIMQNTSIQYFIGIDNDEEIIQWIDAKNGGATNLNVLNKEEYILNKRVSNYGASAGNGCYIVGNINEHYNKSSLTMLSGYQQFNVQVLKKTGFDENYKININDYDKDYIVGEANIDCESYSLNMKKEHLFVFSTTLYCEEEGVSADNVIKAVTGSTTLQSIVYVNNNKVAKNSNGKYSLSFKKGKNKVLVLMYLTSDIDSPLVTFKFNFKDLTQNIGCYGKMKLVSENALKYKTKAGVKDKFAIDTNNNILVKFNPLKTCSYISSANYTSTNINYQDYMRYYITYKFLNKKYYSKCLKHDTPNINLRVMAILNSTDESVSPQIKNYSILVK